MAAERYDPELLARVRALEDKRRRKSAEFWKHEGGVPDKVSKIVFFISLLPFFFWQLIYWMANPYSELKKPEEFADWRRSMFVVGATTVLMLLALVLFLLKKHLPAFAAALVSASAAGFFFRGVLEKTAGNATEVTEVGSGDHKFLIRHLLPLIVTVVSAFIPFLIRFFDRKAERAAYEHASEQIYKQFERIREEENIPDRIMTREMWSRLVAEYDGDTHYGRLKRSLKNARRKRAEADEKDRQAESEKSGEAEIG